MIRPSHHYPISFSANDYIVPSFKLTKTKYVTTMRASKYCLKYLWNIVLNIEKKLIENPDIFGGTIKTKLVPENAIVYFWYKYKTSTP